MTPEQTPKPPTGTEIAAMVERRRQELEAKLGHLDEQIDDLRDQKRAAKAELDALPVAMVRRGKKGAKP